VRSTASARESEEGTLCAQVLAPSRVIKDNSVSGYTAGVRGARRRGDVLRLRPRPDISPAYADIQVHRIAAKNGLSVAQVQKLVDEHTDGRTLRLHR